MRQNTALVIVRLRVLVMQCLVNDVEVISEWVYDWWLCSGLNWHYLIRLEMWANAQRDGRPAEYMWHLLFSATKFGWRPLLECRAVTLRRLETRCNVQGCPKLANRSQPLVGQSSPYCEDLWGRYCCLTSFFSDCRYCLSCEDIAWQSCAMVPRWQIFGDFWGPAFPASRVQHISDLHSKFALGPHHV